MLQQVNILAIHLLEKFPFGLLSPFLCIMPVFSNCNIVMLLINTISISLLLLDAKINNLHDQLQLNPLNTDTVELTTLLCAPVVIY